LTLVSSVESGLTERLAGRVDGHLAAFAEHMREGLLAASTAVGLEVMAELMDAEVTDLAGPKGKHNHDRTATRHGTEAGSVTLGGRRVPVRRPRVRTVPDGEQPACEVSLESYTTLAATRSVGRGHRRAEARGRLDTPVPGRARTRRLRGRTGGGVDVEVRHRPSPDRARRSLNGLRQP
jgi:hypothetical protein